MLPYHSCLGLCWHQTQPEIEQLQDAHSELLCIEALIHCLSGLGLRSGFLRPDLCEIKFRANSDPNSAFLMHIYFIVECSTSEHQLFVAAYLHSRAILPFEKRRGVHSRRRSRIPRPSGWLHCGEKGIVRAVSCISVCSSSFFPAACFSATCYGEALLHPFASLGYWRCAPMRFDSEPFRIQCSQLQQCQNPRDVLIACSSAWALLCAYLQDISDFHVLEHDLSLATLARQLVDSMFSVAKVLLRKRRLPRDVVACCNEWCCALFCWIWTPEGKWCRTAVSVQQIFGAVTMFRSLMWLHMHRFSNLALQFGRMMPQSLQGVFWGLPWNSAARHAAIESPLIVTLAQLHTIL